MSEFSIILSWKEQIIVISIFKDFNNTHYAYICRGKQRLGVCLVSKKSVKSASKFGITCDVS